LITCHFDVPRRLVTNDRWPGIMTSDKEQSRTESMHLGIGNSRRSGQSASGRLMSKITSLLIRPVAIARVRSPERPDGKTMEQATSSFSLVELVKNGAH